MADIDVSNDKIISLSNQWEFGSTIGTPLTNGSIGSIDDYRIDYKYLPRYISSEPMEIMYTNMLTEYGEYFTEIPIDFNYLKYGQETLNSKQKYQMKKNVRCPDPPVDFTYGYCITVHKAQGSEWNKILVFEENFPFSKEEHRRWLYTAITRASEKIVVVKK